MHSALAGRDDHQRAAASEAMSVLPAKPAAMTARAASPSSCQLRAAKADTSRSKAAFSPIDLGLGILGSRLNPPGDLSLEAEDADDRKLRIHMALSRVDCAHKVQVIAQFIQLSRHSSLG